MSLSPEYRFYTSNIPRRPDASRKIALTVCVCVHNTPPQHPALLVNVNNNNSVHLSNGRTHQRFMFCIYIYIYIEFATAMAESTTAASLHRPGPFVIFIYLVPKLGRRPQNQFRENPQLDQNVLPSGLSTICNASSTTSVCFVCVVYIRHTLYRSAIYLCFSSGCRMLLLQLQSVLIKEKCAAKVFA